MSSPVSFGARCWGARLLALGAMLAFALSAGRASAVELDALLGFGQSPGLGVRYRQDSWTPLTVYLTGQGVSGVGQMQVAVKIGERTTLYTRRVPLHDGPLNEIQSFTIQLDSPNPYAFFGGGSGPEIAIQLLKDGRKLAQKKLTPALGVSSETFNVLALTRDGSGMNFLEKKKLGLLHRNVNPASLQYRSYQGGQPPAQNTSPVNPNASLQVLYTDPRALPAMPQGYEMIDAIALADQPLDNLTEDQLSALKGYVQDGGLLIVSGGSDLSRLKSGFLAELLPVQPTGVQSVSEVPELERRYQEPLALGGAAALTGCALKADAQVLLGTARSPLVAARPFGNGVVVFTAFDFLAPEFRGWKVAPALWRDLLRCGNDTLSPRQLLANYAHGMNIGGRGGRSLSDALAGKQASNAPALLTIAVFLGAYLFLLIPVNYFLLKKMDKREFAWFTAPVIIVGFTVTSYLIAQSIKGGMLTAHRAVVLETRANSDQASGYGVMTLYSPRRASYDIAFGDANDANSPYRSVVPGEIFSPQLNNLSGELTIDHDKTTTLRNTLIKLWDKRSFDTPFSATLGGPVEAKTEWVNQQNVRVTVTNKTRYALKGCALVSAGNIADVGDLASGESKQKVLLWKGGSAANLQLPDLQEASLATPSLPGEKTDPPEVTRAKIRSALRQALSQTQESYGWNQSGSFGRNPAALVGWFEAPLLELNVDGKPAQGEEVNMLFVHLPMPENAPSSLRATANPFARAPYLKLEDNQPLGGGKGIFR